MTERTESVYQSAECLKITVIKKQMQPCKAIKLLPTNKVLKARVSSAHTASSQVSINETGMQRPCRSGAISYKVFLSNPSLGNYHRVWASFFSQGINKKASRGLQDWTQATDFSKLYIKM